MAENTVKLRSEEVRVKLHPDMKRRIDRIAEMHGMPTATWCHHVIAQAVVAFERQYQLQNKQQEAITQALTAMMQPMLKQAIANGEVIQEALPAEAGAAAERE